MVGKNFRFDNSWRLALDCLESRRAPDTLYSTIWWFTQWKSRFWDCIVILFRCSWKSKLSNEITNPGCVDFLNSYSSFLVEAYSWWHSGVHVWCVSCVVKSSLIFSLISLSPQFSWEILSLAFKRIASWFPPSLSNVDRIWWFEFVTLSLLSLNRVACCTKKCHKLESLIDIATTGVPCYLISKVHCFLPLLK